MAAPITFKASNKIFVGILGAGALACGLIAVAGAMNGRPSTAAIGGLLFLFLVALAVRALTLPQTIVIDDDGVTVSKQRFAWKDVDITDLEQDRVDDKPFVKCAILAGGKPVPLNSLRWPALRELHAAIAARKKA